MKQIVIIAHNLRSSHNVGSLLRTAEGLCVEQVWLTGYTPYPLHENDTRLPHIAAKVDKDIAKTALDAETLQKWQQSDDVFTVIAQLKADGFVIAALEQTAAAVQLQEYRVPQKIALLAGREVEGIEADVIAACDLALEIPMFGKKESFNVVQAAAMALYHMRFIT